jgi:hypothetical protein
MRWLQALMIAAAFGALGMMAVGAVFFVAGWTYGPLDQWVAGIAGAGSALWQLWRGY